MSDELREKLADVQHGIWAHWMRYQFSQCRRPDLADDGSLIIPADKVQRWQRQMDTEYADLTDKERESDRHQADKVLAVVQPALAQPHLEPCPFCGESDRIGIETKRLHGKTFYYVGCLCGTCGPDSHTRGGAVKNWNGRKTPLVR